MKLTSKAVCLVLACIMLFAMLAGCGNAQKSDSGETTQAGSSDTGSAEFATSTSADASDWEWKKDTSPFEFSMWVGYSWAKGSYDVIDNIVGKNITKKTGVKWNVTIPAGNENEALNLLIASNDLPDMIITDYSNMNVNKLKKGGLVYSYDELIDKYCPNMWKLITKDDKLYHAQSDGKLYYIPNFQADEQLFESTIQKTNELIYFVRNDIYENMGKPKMETPDEFLNVLKRVKSEYPDMIPFQMDEILPESLLLNNAVYNILRGFGIGAGNPCVYEDGPDIKYLFRDPQYVQGLKFVNKMFLEGIITADQLTEKTAQINEKFNNAKYFTMIENIWRVTAVDNPNIKNNLKDEKIKYVLADIFKAPGVTPKLNGLRSKGWMAQLITKNAKNPERIIKFVEYALTDEGQTDVMMGEEGVTYDLVNGEPVLKPEYADMQKQDVAKFGKVGFNEVLCYWIRPLPFDKYSRAGNFGLEETKANQRIANEYAVDYFKLGFADLNPDPGSKEATTNTKILQTWVKYAIKMIMSKTDDEFTKHYTEGIADVDKIGAASVEKVMTEKHQAELEALGNSK